MATKVSKVLWEMRILIQTLKRNLKISSHTVKEKAYKAFVRPALEYAATVWDPYTKKDIDKLEAIQRRAARFVLNRYNNTSSVSNMLENLKWPKLEDRRKTARLTILYKIKHKLVQCPTIRSKLHPAPQRQRRKHDYQLNQITVRTQYRDHSFLPRTIKNWNALNTEAAKAMSVAK